MKHRGFSLIELLVVLSIAAALMALVGPLGVRSLERTQAQSEMVSLQRWYDHLGYQAFIRGKVITIKWQGNDRVAAKMGKKPLEERQLEFLRSEDQRELIFNKSGVPSHASIAVVGPSGRQFDIPIAGLLSIRSAY